MPGNNCFESGAEMLFSASLSLVYGFTVDISTKTEKHWCVFSFRWWTFSF